MVKLLFSMLSLGDDHLVLLHEVVKRFGVKFIHEPYFGRDGSYPFIFFLVRFHLGLRHIVNQ